MKQILYQREKLRPRHMCNYKFCFYIALPGVFVQKYKKHQRSGQDSDANEQQHGRNCELANAFPIFGQFSRKIALGSIVGIGVLLQRKEQTNFTAYFQQKCLPV